MTQQSIHKTSSQLLLLVFLLTVFGCGHRQEKQKLKENNDLLQSQVDSLKLHIDSIKSGLAITFERGLKMKNENQPDSALQLFKSIYSNDSLSIWGILTEDKIEELSNEIGKTDLKNVFEPGDTLLLFQENSKCGEWGGDTYSLKLFFDQDYSKGFHEGEIIGKVRVCRFDCDTLIRNPYSTKPTTVQTKTVRLSEYDKRLVKRCIHDLLEDKLTNPVFISHSGIVNKVQLKSKTDTTLLVEEYPSNRWQKFHGLINDLMTK